jgi:hypothetical protein
MSSFIKIFLFLLLIISFSCETDTIEPRKNPRFSVAFIQSLDASGAQFAANVIEFGNEEILEYGFVYSKSFQPRVENSEKVKREGKPSSQFEISANHSMELGGKYYVAAFMRTPSGYVYSAPVEFESKGSSGFIYQSIQIPDPLYFRDTITVFATDLSRIFGNFAVQVETESAQVVEVGEGFFKFLLPDMIFFTDQIVTEKTMNFFLTVSGKTLQVSAPFNFRKPEFRVIPNQKVNFGDPVFIEGDYMESTGFFQVNYIDSDQLKIPLTGTFNSKIKLGFNPSADFKTSKPKIELVIRGEPYIIENSFEINSKDFIPGQDFTVSTSDLVLAKVLNKNINNIYFNRIVTEDWESPLEISEEASTSSDELGFVLRLWDGVKRENQLFLDDFGKLSKNFITVKLTNPILPKARVSNQFLNSAIENGGRAVSVEDKGYFFAGKEVYRFVPGSQSLTFVSRSQSQNVFSLSNQFAVLALNGKIYTGADNLVREGSQVDFFEFDPVTERISSLPKIPTRATSPLSVYATDKYLYYDGGFIFTEGIGGKPSNERWRFEFSSQTWEKLEDNSFEMGTNMRRYVPFRYKGKLMMMGYNGELDPNTILFEFNESSQRWEKRNVLGLSGNATSNEIFVFEEKAYAIFGTGLWSIDLSTYQATLFDFIDGFSMNQYFKPLLSVGIDNKIYVFNGVNFISEFDPEYFPFP